MTAPSELDRWREAVDEHTRRKVAMRELRRDLDRKRRAGLKARHATKLRRLRVGQPNRTEE